MFMIMIMIQRQLTRKWYKSYRLFTIYICYHIYNGRPI